MVAVLDPLAPIAAAVSRSLAVARAEPAVVAAGVAKAGVAVQAVQAAAVAVGMRLSSADRTVVTEAAGGQAAMAATVAPVG
jgi:hypothetical protein